ncbi:MAG: hypothetical protein QOJ22_1285 [Thermoleophilaceae bacterium]|nr:hypothetical protein [Thermoleophilaceae bacterium]
MPDPLQELLAAGAVPTTSFPPTSRYADAGDDAWDPGNGEPPVPFLRRRLCPRAERLALLYEVGVVEGDRRDVLAHRHVGDAALWWRFADANGAVDPRDLTAPAGRRLRITLPEGVPGPDA